MDLSTRLGKMGNRKKIGTDLGTMKGILDNGMSIFRVIVDSDLDLTLANGIKNVFVAKEYRAWRIKRRI